VDKEKAKYFKLKKYLPSQNIQKENEDGSLIVSFEVTQEREMEEIVKKWIPNMKVIEPLSLKEKIEAELKKYLNIN
jgi:predicted DNA-binding transcriptional regulator YafY